MKDFNLKKFLVENKLTTNSRILNEEVTVPNDVRDFFLKVAAKQLSRVQRYNYHDYLLKLSPQRKMKAGVDYPADTPGALNNHLLDDPEYKEWYRVYDQVHDFFMPQNADKEISLGNGATVTVIGRGNDLSKLEEFIIRK